MQYVSNNISLFSNIHVKFNRYVFKDFQPQAIHYNAILKLYVDNNYDISPSDLLMEMRSKNIAPNNITHQICFEYYCMKGDVNKSLLLLESYSCIFPYYSLEPFFNALLMRYSQLG